MPVLLFMLLRRVKMILPKSKIDVFNQRVRDIMENSAYTSLAERVWQAKKTLKTENINVHKQYWICVDCENSLNQAGYCEHCKDYIFKPHEKPEE